MQMWVLARASCGKSLAHLEEGRGPASRFLRMLQLAMVISGDQAVLALIGHNRADPIMLQQSDHPGILPRQSPLGMFVEEVAACVQLHVVKGDHKMKVSASFIHHLLDAHGIHFRIIPSVVQPAVASTRGRTNNSRRLEGVDGMDGFLPF